MNLNIESEDSSIIIGRKGKNLDALQVLANVFAGKIDSERKIIVDSESYRVRHEEQIIKNAYRTAQQVRKTGRSRLLEPMNPYERRIIHTSVQKVNGAISWSEGENANRHVVIGPDPKYKRYQRNSNSGYNRGRGGRRPYNNNSVNNEVNPDRKPLNEGSLDGLYGRIDK